jgi:hypothetical protein
MTYLGDGVFASFDGYHIWIQTEVDGVRHTIALDDDVVANLLNFIQDVGAEKIKVTEAPR